MIDQTVPLAVVAILNLGTVIAMFIFGVRQDNRAEERRITSRQESERRFAAMLAAGEERSNESGRRSTAMLTAAEERSNESGRRSTAMFTAAEERSNESGRRSTAMLTAAEERFNRRLDESEQRLAASERRLTELYRELNRDTKTLIDGVGFIRGSLGISPSRQGADPDGAAEAA